MNTDSLMQLPREGEISWEPEFRIPEEGETCFVKMTAADGWDEVFMKNGEPTVFIETPFDDIYKPLFLFWPRIDKGHYKYAYFKCLLKRWW